ncbi:hypothetical protein [Oligoflexus tunisiensis]|uniref:hypothetical protein n=1 Tax=Oligoflexus tunisiensis TaxID=708132 RepID=UPI00114CE9AC|nr:hypothetical protein [Oligoflexus tunisiensis]
MLRTIFTFLFFANLSTACKIMPHSIRSDLKNAEVFGLLDESTIRFARSPSGTSGDLTFELKGTHSCRVEYWTEDPNGKPPIGSPLSLNCPNDGKTTAVKLGVDGLVAGIPLTFRITVWPKALNALSGFPLEFRESQNLDTVQAGFLVIARYVAPRQSNEIYTYQLPKVISLSEVKAKMSASYDQDEAVECSETTASTEPPFTRITSVEDAQKRPMHGLSEVSTDGFGRAAAAQHPFFATRLVQFYEGIERQQNWIWNFKWEESAASFETFPPGYIANLSTIDVENRTVILRNRALSNVIPAVEAGPKSFRLTASILYPTEISRYELVIKTADASRTVLRCQYTIDQETLTIPDDHYQKLAAGEYLATLVFETNQIHFKDGASYPPWLITAQDWIHFKINKKM